jgi:hypothetical protein
MSAASPALELATAGLDNRTSEQQLDAPVTYDEK